MSLAAAGTRGGRYHVLAVAIDRVAGEGKPSPGALAGHSVMPSPSKQLDDIAWPTLTGS